MLKQIIEILPPQYRRRGLRVAATLLVKALLNLGGLAVLLPVLALVLDPAWVGGEGWLARMYRMSGFGSPDDFARAICVGVVGLIIIKSLLNIYLSQVGNRYVLSLYRTLSHQLFTAYHHKGLGFIKRSNSAVLTRNVNVVCLAFVTGVLTPAASILAEVLFLGLILCALIAYSPLASGMAVVVFLPSVYLYYILIRNRMVRYGDLENKAQREKMRLVADSFRGYADIEINGAFPKMLHTFDATMERIISIRLKDSLTRMYPQSLIEIGLAAGMALLVGLSLGENATQARLLFGVFAVAALKLLPSIRSILAAWTAIRYNSYTIEILKDAPSGAARERMPEGEPLKFEHEITIRNLSFRFEDATEDLFTNLSLTIHKGERLGIRGASGAGKTTLFNLLLGLYTPTSGSIEIDRQPLTRANSRMWQKRIGYVSQNLFLADGSFAANVALGVPDAEIDRQRVRDALEAAQLGDFIDALPDGMDTPIGECGCRLSGGQRQRIGIARALYREADLLFLDEATSALDTRTEEEVNRAITRVAESHPGLTLIVIAHRETTLEYCNRIITF